MSYVWILFLLLGTLTNYIHNASITKDHLSKDARIIGRPESLTQRCTARIQTTMDSMKKQTTQTSKPSITNVMDLSGYALHQHLRSAPYDMYVTTMRVQVPARSSWYRVEQCYFNPRNKSLDTRIMFNEMAVSGIVKLYDENTVAQDPLLPVPADVCNMTIRLRKSGLSMSTKSRNSGWGPIAMQTSTQFVEPEYVSVYAAGCNHVSPRIEHRSDILEEDKTEERHVTDLTREMEDVFLKGIQSLLSTYMEKILHPALREMLSQNMGYTISYGK